MAFHFSFFVHLYVHGFTKRVQQIKLMRDNCLGLKSEGDRSAHLPNYNHLCAVICTHAFKVFVTSKH